MKLALALALLTPLYARNLTIVGDLPQPLTLARADLAKMARTSVTLNDHGTDTTYEGVLLYDILKQAGAPLDKQLTGKALASYVLAEAHDGSRSSIPPSPAIKSSSPTPPMANRCQNLKDRSELSCPMRKKPRDRSACWSASRS